jgi:hypothetical protein
MPSSNSDASSQAIKRGPCSKCDATMLLARTVAHTPGYQMRTFECPSCNGSESEVAGVT